MPNPVRLRSHISMTVHPDTVARFDRLTAKYRLPRGQIVDKLIAGVDQMVTSGRLVCCTGQQCRIDRTDVPEVL